MIEQAIRMFLHTHTQYQFARARVISALGTERQNEMVSHANHALELTKGATNDLDKAMGVLESIEIGIILVERVGDSFRITFGGEE